MIELKPKEYTKTAKRLYHDAIRIALQESIYATVPYSIWDENMVIEQGVLEFTKEELDTWGSEDSVVENLILNKLNLERA